MQRILFLLFSAAVLAGAQTTADSPTLIFLLQEVRQLRQDLQTLAVVSQRVQLLLHRMQLQEQVVKRLEDRSTGVNSQLENIERARVEVTRIVKDTEDRLASTQEPNQRKQLEQILAQYKRRSERGGEQTEHEQQLRVQQSTLSGELRNEKAKLTELQERLDQIEKQLDAFSPIRPQR